MNDKIICFGKNYADHIHELGDQAVTKPVIFIKPLSILRECKKWGATLNILLPADEVHYEVELVVKLKQGGYQLSTTNAANTIGWYTIGLDMTKRLIQAQLKKAGHPWEIGKVFPDAAIIGPWLPLQNLEDLLNLSFSFSLNGEMRQQSRGQSMLFKPAELISYASQFFPLCEGDILFTGTPAGVGAVQNGSLGLLQLAEHHYQIKWQDTQSISS